MRLLLPMAFGWTCKNVVVLITKWSGVKAETLQKERSVGNIVPKLNFFVFLAPCRWRLFEHSQMQCWPGTSPHGGVLWLGRLVEHKQLHEHNGVLSLACLWRVLQVLVSFLRGSCWRVALCTNGLGRPYGPWFSRFRTVQSLQAVLSVLAKGRSETLHRLALGESRCANLPANLLLLGFTLTAANEKNRNKCIYARCGFS